MRDKNPSMPKVLTPGSQRARRAALRALLATGLAGLAGLLAAAPTLAAEAYPSRKPVTIVAGFPPGGAADQLARLLANRFSIAFKQSFVVENKAGAAGTIGAGAVAKAAPDGYTLLLGVTASQAIAGSIYKDLPYAPEKDFQPISLVAQIPVVMAVHPSVKAKTAQEFIAESKSRGTPFSFASSGAGAIPHLTGELFQRSSGVKLTHVPYKGSAPAMTDLLAGRVELMFDHLPSILPHIRAGKLRPLAMAGAQRAAALPDLPTLSEQGVSGVEVSSWFGLFAPAGTPREVVDQLQAEVVKTLATPEAKAQLQTIGAEPVGNTPAEFARIIASDSKKWSEVVRATGVRAY